MLTAVFYGKMYRLRVAFGFLRKYKRGPSSIQLGGTFALGVLAHFRPKKSNKKNCLNSQ